MDPPPFSLLPYEIVSQICQRPDLDKHDLAALRLTCRSYGIHDAATTSLGKSFEDITVLFSEHSFQTLVNICKHPVFSRCVRSVKPSSMRCNENEIRNIVHTLKYESAWLGYPARFETPSNILNDPRVRSYISRMQNQDEFAQSEEPLALLTQAFQCLGQSGCRIALGAAVKETKGLVYDVSHAKDALDCLWHNAFFSTLDLLITAVSRCELPLTKLKIDFIATEHHDSPWSRQRTIGSTQVNLFSHVKALDLDLFCFKGFNIDQDVARLLQEDVPASTPVKALRVVSVDTDEWLPTPLSQSILRLCMFIPSLFLESLFLVRIETTEPDLLAVLAKVRGTLLHLSIVGCEVDADSLVPAIVYIQDHLTALDELHLAQNMVYSHPFVDVDSSEEQKKRHEGKLLACLDAYGQSDIQSSLAEVLESCQNFISASSSTSDIGDGDW
ncbi:unnamed protein product [Aureobasidium mustum]|uniref:F-box domain-containing protein n=1 Tax=Aureobasidium mustum TaxID=2773714 RepID=A0A9N8K623_9PEZI|nr:unnamed protein product [Aureobasidium mustum]